MRVDSVVLGAALPNFPIIRKDAVVDIYGEQQFGGARYANDPLSWQEFLSKTHRIGRACESATADSQCGKSLVCRKGLCNYCQRSRECSPDQRCAFSLNGRHRCEFVYTDIIRDVFTDPWQFLCSFLIFGSSMMSAAAGVGGGGIFVPLLISMSGLRPGDAIPLSQVMIVFSSFVNLCLFIGQKQSNADRAKIDYNCAALLEPMLVLGVTLGVLINRMAPQWLLTVLLSLTLGYAFWRTLKKARKQRTDELNYPYSPVRKEERSWDEALSSHMQQVTFWTNENYRAILLILLVWMLVFVSNWAQHAILKTCSFEFVVFLASTAATLAILTYAILQWGIHAEHDVQSDDIKWQGTGCDFQYPLIGLGAGALGGLLGIGGGMIMSPLLLELGMHPERVQATTACFVFLSSTMATLQFSLMKSYDSQYVLWYGSITVVATILGQYWCDIYVRQNRRYSLITFSIAGVLCVSLILMCFIGVSDAVEDYLDGHNMGISWGSLCNRGQQSISTVDVVKSLVRDSSPLPEWEGKSSIWIAR